MTLEIRLQPEAEQDLSEAANWYEEQLTGLGNQFLDEAVVAFSSIAESPLMYPIVHRNTRRTLIHRFPFGVYYRVEDTTIAVLAVMHGMPTSASVENSHVTNSLWASGSKIRPTMKSARC